MSLMVLTRAVANFAVCTKFALSAAWVWCREGRRHSVDGGNPAPPMRLPNTYEFTLNRPIKVQQQKRRQRIRLKNASLKIEWHIQCPNSRPAGSTRGSVHNVQRRRQKGLRRTTCSQACYPELGWAWHCTVLAMPGSPRFHPQEDHSRQPLGNAPDKLSQERATQVRHGAAIHAVGQAAASGPRARHRQRAACDVGSFTSILGLP